MRNFEKELKTDRRKIFEVEKAWLQKMSVSIFSALLLAAGLTAFMLGANQAGAYFLFLGILAYTLWSIR